MRTLTAMLFTVAFLLPAIAESADNTLSKQEQADGWQLLFNGKDHTGWICNNGKKVATPIEDDSLVPYKSGGYLVVYEKPFGDFVLKCDVKMSQPHCNSGIFFRVGDLKNPVYTGFEAQVLDGKKTGLHEFGAIYDIVPTSKNPTKGPGKWDSVEIRCEGANIQVKVNGEEVCSLDCSTLTEPGKRPDGGKHKFKKAIADFPRAGYLGFQDHGQKVWFKNIKLLDLTNQKKSEK